VKRTLDRIHREEGPIVELAQGGASGADAHAHAWFFTTLAKKSKQYPAFWQGPCGPLCAPGHRKEYANGTGDYCPAAGNFRNQQMLDEFKPDLVVVFPGGTGTADMAKRAILAQQRGELKMVNAT